MLQSLILPTAVWCCFEGRKIVSSDSHIVKIWDQQTGVNFTNIEPPESGINDICIWKDSGLVMLACDAPKIQVRPRLAHSLVGGRGPC